MPINFGMGRQSGGSSATAPAVEPRPIGSARILIADDDPSIVQLLERILTSAGHQVEVFAEGDSLIERATRNSPDLVLIDAVMPPGINGFQICRLLRENERTRGVPVMMITALSDYADRVYGYEAGADDYVCKPFRPEEVSARVQSLLASRRMTDELLRADDALRAILRAIETKAPHSENVARYAAALGEHMGRSPKEVITLCQAGLLHDVGKIAVPLEVLHKTERLTREEFELIKCHPERGWQMCRRIAPVRDALPAIRWHHERLDGTGYPDGLKGSQIPFIARAIAIVSIFEALTGKRSYRQAAEPERALAILEKEAAQGWWDPTLVAALADMIRKRGLAAAPRGWTGLEQGTWKPVPPPAPPAAARHVPTGRILEVPPPRPPQA